MTNRIFKVGQSREQGSFLPPRIEDYVAPDNPVRRIEACVCALDLAGVGWRHGGGDGGAGQPPYDPADLLKLYLYGYLNQVRSSRRLEREAGRNVELIWLLRGLVPGYRTIGNFRKDNRNALKAANRDFVMLARDLDLLGGDLVAIDGAFFHGDASKASIVTRKRQRASGWRSNSRRWSAISRPMAPLWRPTTRQRRRSRNQRSRRARALQRSLRRCWRNVRGPKPIWRSWRIAARHSCRAQMAMPGC